MISKLFCKHEWEILSETTTESTFEMATRAINNSGATQGRLPWQLCDGDHKHIIVASCSKCGKIKKYVTEL